MEFQLGDQKNGISAAGGFADVPSMEKESDESGSSAGFGSDTAMFASIAVRPLSRCGERGILAPAMRNAADGAGLRAAPRAGRAADIAASTSSRSLQESGFNQRQAAKMSFCGGKTSKNRCARPSLLTKVPSDSAKVPAGRTSSAFSAVRFGR